nr:integrase, catalytic region, zinc finger, CCHC-type, peptidase aspartic, catalytic [Tanacetum cinerariifolium]
SRLCDLFDENNLFIFDDESVRISPVSKIAFKKKPHDSMNVRSKSNSNKSLPRPVHSVGKFCNKGLEVAFRKSTCFVRNEDGVDLLAGDRSSNLYTIALNEVASNSSTCLLAKASSSQSWLWHQRLSHLNFAIINNLVKNNLVQVNMSLTRSYSLTLAAVGTLLLDFSSSANLHNSVISFLQYGELSSLSVETSSSSENSITGKLDHLPSESSSPPATYTISL